MAARDPGPGLREGYLTAQGRRFRYVHGGVGPITIVFESGLSAPAAEWVAVQRAVAEHVASFAYDRAGYGGSDAAPDARTLAHLASDLASVLAAAKVEGPIILVGHSWGGPILRAFAAHSARPIVGVVVVDGTTANIMDEAEARKVQLTFGLMGRISALGLHRPLLRRLLGQSSTGLSQADAELIQRDMLLARGMRAASREARGLVQDRASIARLEVVGFPPGVPVTYVYGALADRGQDELRARVIAGAGADAERIGARFVLASQSSHFVPQQQPDLVVREILELVQRALS